MSEKFMLFKKANYYVFLIKEVDQEIYYLKDKKGQRKMPAWLERLSERIPNKPEQWERVKGYEFEVYELKPKPYRVGCLKIDEYILGLHFWKVQKKMDKVKRKNIETTCKKAEEVLDEFEGFVRSI